MVVCIYIEVHCTLINGDRYSRVSVIPFIGTARYHTEGTPFLHFTDVLMCLELLDLHFRTLMVFRDGSLFDQRPVESAAHFEVSY